MHFNMELTKYTNYHTSVPSFLSDPLGFVNSSMWHTNHPHKLSNMENIALQDFMTPIPFGAVFTCILLTGIL